jgi:chemotaxis protein MotB
MARGVRARRSDEEEESYFISMADMMVGLVFVFLILLLYFALQFRQTASALAGANQTRAEILKKLQKDLQERGLQVTIDTRTGVLRLPENILFEKGQASLSAQGVEAVTKLSMAMEKVLPCYTFPRPIPCASQPHHIDAIFVEGHTDKDAMAGRGAIQDNLDLSVVRATNTYRRLLPAGTALTSMRNAVDANAQPIFSVSGYGPDRPIPGNTGDDEAQKSKNRRIDLRFIMVTPTVPGITDVLVQP